MKKIARITFTVDVSVPDDYSDETVASYLSCLRSYDLKGCLYEGVVFGALSAKPNAPRDFDADVSVCFDSPEPPQWQWPVTDNYQRGAGAGTPRSVRGW